MRARGTYGDRARVLVGAVQSPAPQAAPTVVVKAGGNTWKAILVVAGITAGLYLASPGARYAIKHGHLPKHPDDVREAEQRELDAVARAKGFANAADYREAVRAATDRMEAEGFRVVIAPELERRRPLA